MQTIIHTYDGGQQVEFRRGPDRASLDLESRALCPDGTPHSDRWYLVSDATWATLSRFAPEILRTLLPELAGNQTLTPRG